MLILACGACSDGMISHYLPFILYWAVLFYGWCLLWGLPATGRAQDYGEQLTLRPLRYLLVAILATILLVPVTMGSFLFPMIFLAPIWLVGMYRRHPLAPRKQSGDSSPTPMALAEASTRRIILCTAILGLPLSYLRLYAQNSGWI